MLKAASILRMRLGSSISKEKLALKMVIKFELFTIQLRINLSHLVVWVLPTSSIIFIR